MHPGAFICLGLPRRVNVYCTVPFLRGPNFLLIGFSVCFLELVTRDFFIFFLLICLSDSRRLTFPGSQYRATGLSRVKSQFSVYLLCLND